jgi:hypothetical protein
MKYINTKQASDLTGYSVRTIQRKIKDYTIPAKTIGGRHRILLLDLIALMEFQTIWFSCSDAQKSVIMELCDAFK